MPQANVRITKSHNPPRVNVKNNSDESRFVTVQFTVDGKEQGVSTVIIRPRGDWDAPTPQAAYVKGARVSAMVKLYSVRGHNQKGGYLNERGLVW